MASTLKYMTHVSIPGGNPVWVWAVMLECLAVGSMEVPFKSSGAC
jgi:hypothetical protein